MELFVLVGALVLLILVGAPIGVTMAVLPMAYIAITGDLPLSTVPYQMYEALAHAPLVAIPFFLLTGELMNSGQITDRLLVFSREVVGRFRGGLAQVTILVSMLFAGMNGSVVADTAAVGSVLIPPMKKAGYSPAFSAAVTAVAGTIGGIIPPSIAMILLASGLGLSVGGLFAGGILPGILIGLMLMAVTYVIAVRRGYERLEEPFSLRRLFLAFRAAVLPLTIPLIIVGGMVFGVFTSTEAGAVTAIIAALISGVIYRTLDRSNVRSVLVKSVEMTASVFIIIAAAGPFSWLLNQIGALQGLSDWLTSLADHRVMFITALVGFIFVAGMIMDAVANIIVLGPTLVTACVAAGFPPIQAGLVVTVGFLMGTVTPPVGISYFMAAYIADERLEPVAIALVPFILVEVFALVLMLMLPGLTLWLPGLMGLK
ncbi:MAG TPA: TRAP transporter large permease [Casimicrobiaceae bacterium]|nr:TRAP transporter large permease [Casimicrobiaceae bacterium]